MSSRTIRIGQPSVLARIAGFAASLALLSAVGCGKNHPTNPVATESFEPKGLLYPAPDSGLVAEWRFAPDSSIYCYGSRPDSTTLTISQFALVVKGRPELEWEVDHDGNLAGFASADGVVGDVLHPAPNVTRLVLSTATNDSVAAIEVDSNGAPTTIKRGVRPTAPRPGFEQLAAATPVNGAPPASVAATSTTRHLVTVRCGDTPCPVRVTGVYSFPGSSDVHSLRFVPTTSAVPSSSYWMEIPLELAAGQAIVRKASCDANQLAAIGAACALPKQLRESALRRALEAAAIEGGFLGPIAARLLSWVGSKAINGLCALRCDDWYEVGKEQLASPPGSVELWITATAAGLRTREHSTIPLFSGPQTVAIDVSPGAAGPHILSDYALVSRAARVEAKFSGSVPCAPAGTTISLEVSRRDLWPNDPEARVVGPVTINSSTGQFSIYSGRLQPCADYVMRLRAEAGGEVVATLSEELNVTGRGAYGDHFHVDVNDGTAGDWRLFGTFTFTKSSAILSIASTFGISFAPVYSDGAEGMGWIGSAGLKSTPDAVFDCCDGQGTCVRFTATANQKVRYYDSERDAILPCTIRGTATYDILLRDEGDQVTVVFQAAADDPNANRAQSGPFHFVVPHGGVEANFGY